MNDYGLVDLYVANDCQANFLWLNQGDGTFADDALFAGVAVNRAGEPEASMGVDAGDFDGDGDPDLFMTHLMGESNTLYANQGGGLFEDRSIELGVAAPSLPWTAFGTSWFDYDNDGWLDLLAANGAVRILESLAQEGDPYPLDQPNQLFHNRQGKGFEEVTARAGKVFELAEVSRGSAFGDVDNDGDLDVLLLNNSGPARLLENRAAGAASWVSVKVLGAAAIRQLGRDLLGTRVVGQVSQGQSAQGQASQGRALHRRVRTDGSYCSASDPRALVGLGSGKLASVELTGPRGQRLRLVGAPSGRHWVMRVPDGVPPARRKG